MFDMHDREGAAAVEGRAAVWDSRAVESPYRLRRALAVAGVLLALAFAVPRVATHMPYQRLGLTLAWTADGHAHVQEVVGPPSKGLLEPGDVLVGMNGEPFSRDKSSGTYTSRSLPKDAITFDILRHGARLQILVPPVRLTLWQRVRFLLFRLAALIAAPIVAFALVWRRPDLGTARVFLWYAALQGIAFVFQIYRHPEVELTGAFKQWMGLYGWLACWAPAAFVHFLAVFPRPRWRPEARMKSVWFWLVALSYVVPVYFVVQLLQTGHLPERPYMFFESGALAIGVVSLIERYAGPSRGEWNPARSQRVLGLSVAAVMLIGGAVSWLLDGERGEVWYQFPAVRLLVTILGFGLLLTPFALAYLLARDPIFDPRRILERSIPYALLSGVLAAVYLSLVFVGQSLFAAATGEGAVGFNVVAALVLAFAFAPLKERMQRALDRLFRRDPLALRAALDQAGRELLGALDRDEVRASVDAGLTRGIGRSVPLDWSEPGGPTLASAEDLPEHARAGVENLLLQARIRLENVTLQAERAAAERRALELREAATSAELRALHAQVQPHFLFNALNALSYLTEVDPPAAQRFTERLADMLRYTVQASERPAVLLSDEIAFVEDYLGVARERYEGELLFRYRGPQELLSAAVPPLVLQPLVENSLKHGFSGERRSIHLDLDAETHDGWLTLRFTDDGCNGQSSGNGERPHNGHAAPRVRGLGVGLDNLEQRIRRFGGSESSMAAGPAEAGGYRVTLRWRQVGEVAR
jgi:hypothetical protein